MVNNRNSNNALQIKQKQTKLKWPKDLENYS